MSKISTQTPFKFQDLRGKKITYSATEKSVLKGLSPISGGEWKGKIKTSSSVKRKDRDSLVKNIKTKLIKIQGSYCIYCGLHESHCGSKLQREHILPKGKKNYPAFTFEPENLCLACHRCNVELKGEVDLGSGNKSNYKKNNFKIVHPYFDDFSKHIELNIKGGKALIKKKPYSRKGKRTIELFELDSPERTTLRSGLIIISENPIKSKYDSLLNGALSKSYIS
jgi:uncharacterized protein (TIGR02646 family)